MTRGYISNTAIGQFDVNGCISTVSSNTVTVDTDGQENFYYVYPFYPVVPGVDSEYDPGTGWFPSIDSDPEGEDHPFGIIDTDALHIGNTCCVRTIPAVTMCRSAMKLLSVRCIARSSPLF